MLFIAYDKNAIYAVAGTAEGAVDAARQETKNPNGQFDTARCAAGAARYLAVNGFDATSDDFEVDGGELVAINRHHVQMWPEQED